MISAVIPVYNEDESVEQLHRELVSVLSTLDAPFEIIFVDDGSTDRSPHMLQQLDAEYEHTHLITFIRNFGKSAAYTAGFHAAAGDIIVTLDADLQDDPAQIPGMLDALSETDDLVVGWKQDRFKNEPLKAVPSKIYNAFVSLIFDLKLHDANCGFRVLRRRVALGVELRGDLYRFIPQLAHMRGFEVTEHPVQHQPREHGHSKYGPRRFWTGLLDILTVRFLSQYISRPLHFLGTLGLVPLIAGIGLEIYVLTMKLAFGSRFRTHMAALVVGVMLILTAVQFVATGLIGEMLSSQGSDPRFVLDRKHTAIADRLTNIRPGLPENPHTVGPSELEETGKQSPNQISTQASDAD